MSNKTKIAVIQLTRIGDLIQTTQAARQLKAENSDAHVTLIARGKFARGITFLLETVFDEIILFDTNDFFQVKEFKGAKKEVTSFINSLNSKKFDFSINLSFSKSSSYLSSVINAEYKMGISRNDKSEITISDKWSQYIYSNVMNGTNVPFSLVDIYRYIMGVEETLVLDPDPDFIKRGNNIVIHPFASQRKKKWGISRWAELIYRMSKEQPESHFHIVGGKEDESEATRLLHTPSLQNLNERIHIHASKSSIKDTYKLLMDARLFIGHDSMVSHLASETLTPSVIISLGTVRPFETSPYNNLAINIAPKNKCYPCNISEKCDLLPCHNSINHQVVSVIADGILKGETINKNYLSANLTPLHLDPIRVYGSSYDHNGLVLDEVSNNHSSVNDVFKAYYKIIWLYYLRGVETNSKLPDISKSTAQALQQYTAGVNYLFELYNFGVKYSNKIIEGAQAKETNFAEIQSDINKLAEIDNLCNITKRSYPLLQGLVDYFYVNKANALGDNLLEISQHNLLNYYDASNLIAVINDFIEKSVSPHITPTEVSTEV
jgi:ADP-heptose:LPS heptosyltransferase